MHHCQVSVTDRWDPSDPSNTHRLREAQRAVRGMLRQWDAIGVGDAPQAADGYGCIVPPLAPGGDAPRNRRVDRSPTVGAFRSRRRSHRRHGPRPSAAALVGRRPRSRVVVQAAATSGHPATAEWRQRVGMPRFGCRAGFGRRRKFSIASQTRDCVEPFVGTMSGAVQLAFCSFRGLMLWPSCRAPVGVGVRSSRC